MKKHQWLYTVTVKNNNNNPYKFYTEQILKNGNNDIKIYNIHTLYNISRDLDICQNSQLGGPHSSSHGHRRGRH